MAQGVFKFHVQNLSFGNCRVTMLINDKEIHYDASYIGDNPLATLIDACADLLDTSGLAYIYGDGRHFIEWQAELGTLSIDLTLDKEGMLHFDIVDDKDRNDIENPEWHEVIPFDAFLSAVMEEGFRVLNAFGLCGYRTSWCNDTDFPLTNLLRITGKCEELRKGDSFTTDIVKEIEVLQNHISKFKITEEKEWMNVPSIMNLGNFNVAVILSLLETMWNGVVSNRNTRTPMASFLILMKTTMALLHIQCQA